MQPIEGFWEDGIYWGNVGYHEPMYTAFTDEESYLEKVNDPDYDPLDYMWN